MKLNLLPTHVSKEGATRTAVIIAAVMSLAAIAGAAFMVVYSNQQLNQAKAIAEGLKPKAEQAVTTAKRADEIRANAVVITRNLNLAREMQAHNNVYPDLYRQVLQYVPSFYRVTSLTASPLNESQASVTITGVLQTYQQYADVMLALLRMPDVVNVTRAGYAIVSPSVPALNEQDQDGRSVNPGQTNLPSDPWERLQAKIAAAEAAPRGFLNVSGFGTATVDRGAMPDWSTVTLNVILNKNIQTPEPRTTLAQQGGASAPAPGGATAGGGRAPGAGAPVAPPPGAGGGTGEQAARAGGGGRAGIRPPRPEDFEDN
ncbi:MAG: hypothetical protein KIT11_11055 [Fimbriimonadaceae bacterium]|nr:hypothetical protein [Fimbriimonadaceae bacterium]QYK55859.1 MAG: hypothetical protein KF733_12725 [Fimbriimonadaceae bacterium]